MKTLTNFWYLTRSETTGAQVWRFAAASPKNAVPDGFVYVDDADVPADVRPGEIGDGQAHEVPAHVLLPLAKTA